MKQYVVIGRDGTDNLAGERRMQVRPDHLAGARKLKEAGNYVLGGAMLDESGKMKGSVMIVQFESDEAFRDWYDHEPYVVGKVWHQMEVVSFKVAEV